MTTKPSIHIQPDLFWEDEHRTPNSVEAANYFKVAIRSDEEIMSPDFLRPYRGHVMRGSMTMAQKCGVTFGFAHVDKWLPKFREIAVNDEAVFVDMKYAQTIIATEGDKYLRPLSPFKEFAGQLFSIEQIDKEVAWLKQGKNINAEELMCAISPARYINREWRCIFVDNKYVGGSQYMQSHELEVSPEVPERVIEFAQSIAADSYFTNIFDFVLDVGECYNVYNATELKLVELNGFETASFYAADLAKIYSAWAKSLDAA